MASAGLSLQQQAKELERTIRTLTNDRLKEICRSQRVAVSGVKASLQARIVGQINEAVRTGNAGKLWEIRNAALPDSHSLSPTLPPPRSTQMQSYSNSIPKSSTSYSVPNGYARPMPSGASAPRPSYYSNIKFRASPFYDILEPLVPPIILGTSTTGKSVSTTNLILTEHNSERLRNEKDLAIMLYATPDPALSPYNAMVDIAFPQHLEVRINGDEIKANYKGLKGKPGTTRPVDITRAIRNLPNYKNAIHIMWAYTDKKYHFVINFVRRHSVEELAERLRNGQRLSREQVMREMQKKADDPDLIATSFVMSLKDPVSYTRISIPVRSTVCTHNQCFDASSFLQLQEQAPTWICPVCQKSVTFGGLLLDLYVNDILSSTPSAVEQVTIEPGGKWTAGSVSDKNGGDAYDEDDDDSDDLVEVSGPPRIKQEPSDRLRSLLFPSNTPPASREVSSIPTPSSAARHTTGSKRTSDVIDLTLSDDDEPPRPNKRPTYEAGSWTASSSSSQTPNGYRPPNSPASQQSTVQSRTYAYPAVQPIQLRPPPQPPSHQGPSGLMSQVVNTPVTSLFPLPPPYNNSYGMR